MANESVWTRKGQGDISRQKFNLIMGLCIIGGIIATAITAYHSTGWVEFVPKTEAAKASFNWVGPNVLMVVVGVVISAFAGVVIALASKNAFVSLVGYGMVCIPFGFLVGPTVAMYSPESVLKVFIITGGVTGVMMLIGVCIPDSLESWGGWLFGGLSILIIGTFGLQVVKWMYPGLPVQSAMTALDWLGVLLFSVYIIYDINRAQHVAPTTDNAVDSALALYLDILNLFLKLLRIFGGKKTDE